jgi:hypothetical protein
MQILIVFNLVVYCAYHIYVMVVNSLIFISEIINCVWELSLRIPISNKSTQLNLCLSARKQTDMFVTLQLSNSDMQTHFKYSPY